MHDVDAGVPVGTQAFDVARFDQLFEQVEIAAEREHAFAPRVQHDVRDRLAIVCVPVNDSGQQVQFIEDAAVYHGPPDRAQFHPQGVGLTALQAQLLETNVAGLG
jgi:hypothetical protein